VLICTRQEAENLQSLSPVNLYDDDNHRVDTVQVLDAIDDQGGAAHLDNGGVDPAPGQQFGGDEPAPGQHVRADGPLDGDHVAAVEHVSPAAEDDAHIDDESINADNQSENNPDINIENEDNHVRSAAAREDAPKDVPEDVPDQLLDLAIPHPHPVDATRNKKDNFQTFCRSSELIQFLSE